MNLLLLSEKIKHHFPVSPDLQRDVQGRRTAAVLVILFPRHDEAHVLMIKRAGHLERHAGEIAFPGGMFDAGDMELLHTALRETREELHLAVATDSIVGRLTSVTTSGGVDVTPFVALVTDLPHYEINEAEVELALEIPLHALLATRQKNSGPGGGDVFLFEKHRIWGASARILCIISQIV